MHSTLNLGLDIRIPPEYISEEHQRLRAYKRIADARNKEDAERILEEMQDRYGAAPGAVLNLIKFSVLKSMAQKLGIEAIDRRQGIASIKFHKESRVDPARLMSMVQSTKDAQFTPAGVLRLPLDGTGGAGKLLEYLGERLAQLG